MNKSKLHTIFIMVGLFMYFSFSQIYLLQLGTTFTDIINPMFWALIAVGLKFLVVEPRTKKAYKGIITKYLIITILLYVLVYFLSGLLTGFGKSPYLQTFLGLIYNLYAVGFVVFCKEYIRYRLINNVTRKDRNLIFVFLVIVFSLLDIKFSDFTINGNVYYIAKNVFSIFIPIITKNILLTYLAEYTNYILSFIYSISMYLILWIPPILPNSPWILTAILDTIFPLILFLYCRYYVYKQERFHLNKVEPFNPKGMIPLTAGVVAVIWFALGIFPVRPIGVATGSMEPNIHIGDMVLIDQKVNVNDIKAGDVIQYGLNNYTVIHRVEQVYQEEGHTYFKTKGDNNEDSDLKPVSEGQLKGKVIYRIPYIALPTIWLNQLSGNQSEVEVETGR